MAGGAEIGTRLPAKQSQFTPGLNSGVGVGVCFGVEAIEGGTGDENHRAFGLILSPTRLPREADRSSTNQEIP